MDMAKQVLLKPQIGKIKIVMTPKIMHLIFWTDIILFLCRLWLWFLCRGHWPLARTVHVIATNGILIDKNLVVEKVGF